MICESLDFARELYFAILMDRDSQGPVATDRHETFETVLQWQYRYVGNERADKRDLRIQTSLFRTLWPIRVLAQIDSLCTL